MVPIATARQERENFTDRFAKLIPVKAVCLFHLSVHPVLLKSDAGSSPTIYPHAIIYRLLEMLYLTL